MTRYHHRRHYFIDKNFQTKFILLFCLIVVASSALAMGIVFYLSRDSHTVAIERTQVIVKTTADFILPLLLETVLIVLAFSSIAVIVLAVFFSHKVVGPLLRLTQEVKAVENGDLTRVFQTRTQDQLQRFSEGLCQMTLALRQHIVDVKEISQQLRSILKKREQILTPDEQAKACDLLDHLNEKLKQLKT